MEICYFQNSTVSGFIVHFVDHLCIVSLTYSVFHYIFFSPREGEMQSRVVGYLNQIFLRTVFNSKY